MNELFLALLAIPLIVPFVMKIWTKGTIQWSELAICTLVTVLAGATVFYTGRYSETNDYEVWNGKVTKVYNERYQCYVNGYNGCEHYYTCNCHTTCSGTGENKVCTVSCDRCPVYDWEKSYFANTTIGVYNLGRGDRQGTIPSERWLKAYVGEPVSDSRSYTNWVKAVPDSLFNKSQVNIATLDKVPEYPIKVYNTWYVDRVVSVGVPIENIKEWNFKLQEMLSEVGSTKQANVIIMFVPQEDSAIRNAARVKWIGGKKNDVVLIIGVDNTEISWVDVFSWSKNGVFDVQLREEISSLKNIDFSEPNQTINLIKKNINANFVRRPMKEFEYLKDEIKPSIWVIVLTFILSLGVAVGSSVYMHKNELFNNKRRYY